MALYPPMPHQAWELEVLVAMKKYHAAHKNNFKKLLYDK